LVTVVAERQRLGKIGRQRDELREVRFPFARVQGVETDARRPALVAEAQAMHGEFRGPHRIEERVAELGVVGGRQVLRGRRHARRP
jgi:hypothetical protein